MRSGSREVQGENQLHELIYHALNYRCAVLIVIINDSKKRALPVLTLTNNPNTPADIIVLLYGIKVGSGKPNLVQIITA